MNSISRRHALATAVAATIAGGLVPRGVAAEPRLDDLGPLAALPPHWLDPVIGDGTDAAAIAARLGKNKTFIELVARTIKEVKDNPPPAGLVGPTYPQRVRLKMMSAFCNSDDLPVEKKLG